LIIDELARLERYRKVATHHGLTLPQDGMLPAKEIDYLQRQLNATLFLEADSWMLPSWAVLSLKDFDRERKLVTEFSNDMYRNWSLIGGVGAEHFAVIDSRGLLSTRIDTGAIDFWLFDKGQLVFPALMDKDSSQLKLVSSEDQIYEWKNHVGPIEFTRLVYHVKKNGAEYVYNEIILRNHDLERTKFSFCILMRPISVLGIEPIELIECEGDKLTVYVNGLLSTLSDTRPATILFAEANDGELPDRLMTNTDHEGSRYTSTAGLATIIARYDITLGPAGSEHIFFWSPLSSIGKSDEIIRIEPKSQDRDNSIGEWFAFSDQCAKGLYPNEQLDTAFSQATASLAMQAVPAMFPEDPQLAALNWRDRIRILLALLQSGALEVAERVVSRLREKLSIPEDQLNLSIYGPILWGFHQYHEYTQSSVLDDTMFEFLKRLTAAVVETIKTQISEEASAFPDETTSEEEQDLLQHRLIVRPEVISNLDGMFWNLAALVASRSIMSAAHENVLVVTLDQVIEKYRERINSVSSEIEQARWLKPTDPLNEHVEDEIVDLVGTAAQFKRYGIDMDFVERLYTRIPPRRLIHSLWKSFQPTERYSSHVALRIAQYFSVTERRDEVEPLLKRALEFLSDDYHLPEYVNPRSYGGSDGAGLSVRASTDLILLLYDMLIHEREAGLIALQGAPEEWFTSRRPLIVDGLVSTRGTVHIEIGASANQYQIEIGMCDFPEEIEIHIPSSVPISMVKVYGGTVVERTPKASSPLLKIIPLSDQIVLTYRK
jgi:hypothetical protein